MKLYYSSASPYARKCLVAAHELGLRDSIELVAAAPHPVDRDRALVAVNPLGKVPTLVTDDGTVLYDSRVICEYLNAMGDGHLIPRDGAARWSVLVDESLGDGIMDAALLARYETAARPEALRWKEWTAGQLDKVASSLDELERRVTGFADRADLGAIALATALAYLDHRFPALPWRAERPATAAWFERFTARTSMAATRPAPA